MDRAEIKKRLVFWYSFLWIFLFIALYLAYAVYFLDITLTKTKWIGLFAGSIAIFLAVCKICEILCLNYKNAAFDTVVRRFSHGFSIFTNRIFQILLIILLPLFLIFLKFINTGFASCFLVGAILVQVLIICSNFITTKASARIHEANRESVNLAAKTSFNLAVSIAFLSVGLSIAGIVILYHFYRDFAIINAFVFGAALVSLINISVISVSKKALDDANDAVINFVAQIEKKDKRNPLLLLCGLSKGFLDVPVLALDIFVSFSVVVLSSISIGVLCINLMGTYLPVILAGSGVFSSIIVILSTRITRVMNPIKTLYISAFFGTVLMAVITLILVRVWADNLMGLAYSTIIGLFGGYLACFININCISNKFKSAKNVALSCTLGAVKTIFQTIKEGFSALFAPMFLIAVMITGSFLAADGINFPLFGIYGISLCALGVVCALGLMTTICIFAHAGNNTDVIYEFCEEKIYSDFSHKDNILNEICAYLTVHSKSFINVSSILSSLCALFACAVIFERSEIDLLNPYILLAVLIGVCAPFLYCGFMMGLASKVAKHLVLEVKKQFSRFPQIMQFQIRPDYEKCISVCAFCASLKLIFPIILILALFFALSKININILMGLIWGFVISSCVLIFLLSCLYFVSSAAKAFFEQEYDDVNNNPEYGVSKLNYKLFSSFSDLIVPNLNIMIKFLPVLLLALAMLFI